MKSLKASPTNTYNEYRVVLFGYNNSGKIKHEWYCKINGLNEQRIVYFASMMKLRFLI